MRQSEIWSVWPVGQLADLLQSDGHVQQGATQNTTRGRGVVDMCHVTMICNMYHLYVSSRMFKLNQISVRPAWLQRILLIRF